MPHAALEIRAVIADPRLLGQQRPPGVRLLRRADERHQADIAVAPLPAGAAHVILAEAGDRPPRLQTVGRMRHQRIRPRPGETERQLRPRQTVAAAVDSEKGIDVIGDMHDYESPPNTAISARPVQSVVGVTSVTTNSSQRVGVQTAAQQHSHAEPEHHPHHPFAHRLIRRF